MSISRSNDCRGLLAQVIGYSSSARASEAPGPTSLRLLVTGSHRPGVATKSPPSPSRSVQGKRVDEDCRRHGGKLPLESVNRWGPAVGLRRRDSNNRERLKNRNSCSRSPKRISSEIASHQHCSVVFSVVLISTSGPHSFNGRIHPRGCASTGLRACIRICCPGSPPTIQR